MKKIAGIVFNYDQNRRLTSATHQNGAGSALVDYSYQYDAANRLTQETHHGMTQAHSYNARGELTATDHSAFADEAYTYDANGNRTSGGSTVGPNNQISADATFDYSYDDEGSLIGKRNRSTNETVDYTYDHRHRLTSVQFKASNGTIQKTVSFTYDIADRRIGKSVDGVPVYTLYNRDDTWADYNASQSVLSRYLFGDSVDEILARTRSSDGLGCYLTDHLGTVRDVTDAGGNIADHVDYGKGFVKTDLFPER